MKIRLVPAVLVLVSSAVTAAVIIPLVATAQSDARVVATDAQPPTTAAPLVGGLPDFTRLVEQVGPAVVNVEISVGGTNAQASRSASPDDEQIPEIFRRIFGPGFQMPSPGEQSPGAPRRAGLGSGFIISSDGYVLTNHHVVSGASEVKVTLTDRREFTAKVVGSDQQSDVALLKIDATGLPTLRTGNAADVRPGQWAIAIGSPFGFDQSVTAGIVSATGRSNPYADQRYVPFIQSDVAINRGNSGGPLLNTAGEVIGINSQIFSASGGYQGISFAIPIDVAMNVVDQLKTSGQVRRGQIGVQFSGSNITSEQARGFGLPDTLGALISAVVPDGPAAKAGIVPGDVIRAVDGTRIVRSTDLPPLIGNKAPGTRVKLTVFREGRERNIDVTLSQLDETAVAGVPTPRPSASTPQTANVLGIAGQDLDEVQRRRLGLESGEGVGVARVEGIEARNAGISPGDVILQVGRTAVGSVAELDRQLRDIEPGQTVMLLIRSTRGGTQFIAVTPSAKRD